MYNVIIIDDEKPIVEGLKVFLDWNGLGFNVAGEALNGLAGAELAEAQLPHVIITDIRMPVLDGIEMMARIKTFNPACKFIILSGYSDFEYAREALEKGASCYLLKPVNKEELISRLLRIKEELGKDDYKKNEEQKLKKQLRESLPILRERYLNKIVNGEFAGRDEICRVWEYVGIKIPMGGTCAMMVEIDDLFLKYRDNVEERLLTKLCATNIIEEVVRDHFKAGVVFTREEDRLVIICCDSGDFRLNNQNLFILAGRIRYYIEKYIGETVTVSAGSIYDNPARLNKSFKEAEKLV